MPLKRMGLQTIDLPLRPAVCASAAFVGKKEGEGPLGAQFDHVARTSSMDRKPLSWRRSACTWTPSAKPFSRVG